MENSDEVVKPLDAVIIIQDRKNVDWDQEEVAREVRGFRQSIYVEGRTNRIHSGTGCAGYEGKRGVIAPIIY